MKRILSALCLCLVILSACGANASPATIQQSEEIEPSHAVTQLPEEIDSSPTVTLSPEEIDRPPAITRPPEDLPFTPESSDLPEEVPEKHEIFEYMGLVELLALDPTFVIDVKYATEDNFTGEVLYDRPLVLVQKEVGLRLVEAQKLFAAEGYGLKIFDIYRPLSIQQKLYDATPAGLKRFVAKPSLNAKHCKGIAVDCTLVDLSRNEIEMPSGYDEFSDRAYIGYSGGTEEQRKSRDYLISTMERCGFTVYESEWWHFVAPDDGSYETLDISFSEFLTRRDEGIISDFHPGT